MFIEQFTIFHPFTGRPPEIFRQEFSAVLVDARSLLQDWDAEMINIAVKELDWLIWQTLSLDEPGDPSELAGQEVMQALGDWARSLKDDSAVNFWSPTPLAENERLRGYQSPLQRVHDTFAQQGRPDIDVLPDASWSQLFAVGALAHVGEVCSRIHRWRLGESPTPLEPPITDIDFCIEAGRGLYLATDAINLSKVPIAEENAKSIISKKASASAKTRYKELDQIKDQYFAFYDAGDFETLSKSREAFIEQMSDEIHRSRADWDQILERAMQARNRRAERKTT